MNFAIFFSEKETKEIQGMFDRWYSYYSAIYNEIAPLLLIYDDMKKMPYI